MEFREKVPYSSTYDDIYYSKFGGTGETLHVFFEPNRLRERLRNGSSVRIVELGFGTGLNFAVTLNEILKEREPLLEYISIEKHPLSADRMDQALSFFPELDGYRDEILPRIPPPVPGFHRVNVAPGITLTLLHGDAVEMLQELSAKIDAWYLDGFAPAKNPGLWNGSIYAEMARLSARGATVSTYTAAGSVRRGLEAAGFRMSKLPGYGMKREMLAGLYSGSDPVAAKSGRLFDRKERPWFHIRKGRTRRGEEAIIVGAGIAGSSMAYSLSLRGIHATVIDREEGPARKASGNPLGILYPPLTAARTNSGLLGLSGFCHTLSQLRALQDLGYDPVSEPCGMIQIAGDEREMIRLMKSVAGLPDSFAHLVDERQGEEISRMPSIGRGVYFPGARIVNPGELCRQNLLASKCDTIYSTQIVRIEREESFWIAYDAIGRRIAEAPLLILAAGHESIRFAETAWIPIDRVFGQIACADSNSITAELKTALCGELYMTPARDGRHVIGAAYRREQRDERTDPELTSKILSSIREMIPGARFDRASAERSSFRAASEDYLPVAGLVPDRPFFETAFGGLSSGKTLFTEEARHIEGLYILSGLGSKGLAFAPLCAEIIASVIAGEAPPLQQGVIDSLNPARFLIRKMIRNYATSRASLT